MPNILVAATRAWHTCANCNNDILPGQEYRRVGRKKYHQQPDCAQAISEVAKEAPPLPDEFTTKFHIKYRIQLLRCYEGRAKEPHDCHDCTSNPNGYMQMKAEILPGDRYTAEVWLVLGEIEVRFFHDSCPFDPDWDDDREEHEFDWEDKEVKDPFEESLPLAA